MNGGRRPTVTIEHALSGRLRIRLSHALRHPARVRRLVAEHAGVADVCYTAVSRSMLVHYDPAYISTEEIVIRIATGLSLERDNAGVRVLMHPAVHELTDSAFYSGLTLLAALALRLLDPYATGKAALERIAGLTTAGAALYHGWVDYRLRGNFDPEVLSVTYLLTALLRGNSLPAALVTWVGTFGRHLVRLPARGIIVRPTVANLDATPPHLEVVVTPDPGSPDKMAFFRAAPSLVLHAMTGDASARGGGLLDDIRQIAMMHDQVLEGVTDFQRGIRLHVRDSTTLAEQ